MAPVDRLVPGQEFLYVGRLIIIPEAGEEFFGVNGLPGLGLNRRDDDFPLFQDIDDFFLSAASKSMERSVEKKERFSIEILPEVPVLEASAFVLSGMMPPSAYHSRTFLFASARVRQPVLFWNDFPLREKGNWT